MKILTTAAFSVFLLRKRLSPSQWLALVCLAIGVGIVQVQSGVKGGKNATVVPDLHTMRPIMGFAAVTAACFTSGLAGVYFEMVLKNSQTNLWVRNVQLSLFSLLPAVAPILLSHTSNGTASIFNLFQNFGLWAWTTVAIQVLGGLLTALVIKYSDNILKGFATSLSIVISFLTSVLLFDFRISFTFILGSVIVLIATWLYNQPPRRAPAPGMKETLSLSLSLSASLAEKGRPIVPVRSPTQEFASYAVSRSTSLSSFTSLPDPEFDIKNPRI
jgi:solute carrier family 35 (UDP-sugar transporter), member A1/2/3